MPTRTLSQSDIEAIAEAVRTPHICRFDNVRREDMDFLKDLIIVYKETRSEVIKWAVKGIIYGVLILVIIGAYIKLGRN
jgi:hypothetical protein